MEWWIIVAILIAGIIGLAIMQNQMLLAVFIICCAVVGIAVFYWLNRPKDHPEAIEVLRRDLLRRAQLIDNRLGFLYLSGGKDKQRLYFKVILGQISGWTSLNLPPQKHEPPETLYVFRYRPRGVGLVADIINFVVSLPIISMFLGPKDRLFAVTSEQLGENSLTQGDIILLGTAMDTVSIFDTLSTPDLDKRKIMGVITSECKNITLEDLLNELPEIVGTAISGDSAHSKIIEALHGQAKDYGIGEHAQR
jgi:hypothetical protein